MSRIKEMVKAPREQPSLYCVGHKQWIVTQEKVNMFAMVDGVRTRVRAWRCPACRGDVGVAVQVAAPPRTAADESKDERLGPFRKVVPSSIILSANGKSATATLECGHTTSILPKMREARCRKCRASAKEAG